MPASLSAAHGFSRFVSHPDGVPLDVLIDGGTLRVGGAADPAGSAWRLSYPAEGPVLSWQGQHADATKMPHTLAALEAAFTHRTDCPALSLSIPSKALAPLIATGVVTCKDGSLPTATRQRLWQQPALWLPQARPPYPVEYQVDHQVEGKPACRHPARPPKPVGMVYQRHIPWLQQTFSLRTIDPASDLATFNRWMNDPVVAHFWQEEGDLDKHRAYIDGIAADPRVLGLIGCFDGEPACYVEAYWAKEDRIAPHCDAQDFDRGWHVLVGEARFRGRPWLTAWMPSVSHYLLLDDCRTQRIVIEPRIDNDRMLKSLALCGYAHLKTFDFPHKRAMLSMLLRERFFDEALWIPHTNHSSRGTHAHP